MAQNRIHRPQTGAVAKELIRQGVPPLRVVDATRAAVEGSGITLNSVYTYRAEVHREDGRVPPTR